LRIREIRSERARREGREKNGEIEKGSMSN